VPTYEYRCSAGHQYEKRESFSAPSRQKCQVCGKQADRVLFAPPIVFKGQGFYVTDSRGSSGSTTTTTNGASADAKSDAKTDSAPADTSSATETPAAS
jgi:putative FmdB family regulatory protein